MSKTDYHVYLGCFTVMSFILGMTFGTTLTRNDIRQKAIAAGVATYVNDTRTGAVTFEWKK